jgi:hypothetical protein
MGKKEKPWDGRIVEGKEKKLICFGSKKIY